MTALTFPAPRDQSGLAVLSTQAIERVLRRYPPRYPDPSSIDQSWRARGTASETFKSLVHRTLRCPTQEEFAAEYAALQDKPLTEGRRNRILQLYCGHVRELHAWSLVCSLIHSGAIDAVLWNHDLDATMGIDFILAKSCAAVALHARATDHWIRTKQRRHPPAPGLLHVEWFLDRLPPTRIGDLLLFSPAHLNALAADLTRAFALSRLVGAPLRTFIAAEGLPARRDVAEFPTTLAWTSDLRVSIATDEHVAWISLSSPSRDALRAVQQGAPA